MNYLSFSYAMKIFHENTPNFYDIHFVLSTQERLSSVTFVRYYKSSKKQVNVILKLIYMEISLRLEDWLERKLKQMYPDLDITLCEKDDTYLLLEEGRVYDTITIRHDNRKFTTKENSDVFWEIIQELEEKRTVLAIFEKMVFAVKKTSPDVFDDEFHPPFVIGGVMEYLIISSVVAVVIAIGFPVVEHRLTQWFQSFF